MDDNYDSGLFGDDPLPGYIGYSIWESSDDGDHSIGNASDDHDGADD